jgi:solute carrier family 34 (sodium-dependent phosphate cotransporter)
MTDSAKPQPRPPAPSRPAFERAAADVPAWLRGVYAGLCLYLFLCAINIMGAGLGTFGAATDVMERAFAYGANPFIALLGAVLVTVIVQSSSFTTALIITLVATGELPLGTAVYAIMGANIGTSVTTVLVSLASLRVRADFRRSFTAALLHDFFNLLTVAVLFPLEWLSGMAHAESRGILTRFAHWLSSVIGIEEVANPNSPIKVLTRPMVTAANWLGDIVTTTPAAQGLVVGIGGLLLLFVALVFMVKNLRGALLRRMDGLFRSYFFVTDLRSYLIGSFATVMVQSSTITTSLMVPLAGAGIVPLARVFSFMLGANLGTTITGVLAATANPMAAAVTVALFHVTFNLVGTLIWYPLRRVPMAAANWYGGLAAGATHYAFLFLFLVFFIIPVIGIAITELIIAYS